MNTRIVSRPSWFAALCLLTISFVHPLAGAQTDAVPPPSTRTAPRVTSLEGELELGQTIRVGVSGLAAWLATNDATKLVPFINGRAIHGNYPEEVHAAGEHLHFVLEIAPQNRAVWIDVLGAPQGLSREVEFSVGLEGGSPFPTNFHGAQLQRLIIVEPAYGWLAAGVIVATFVTLVMLARKTGMLRDAGTISPTGERAPYNLGRAQMAFWFCLTFASYIVIWLITDAIDTITPSLLALMGISAGTALSEVLIDSNKDATAAAALQTATAEKQALEQGVTEMQAQLAALNAKAAPTTDDAAARDNLNRQLLEQRTRLNQAAQTLNALAPSARTGVSRGFVRDILSDGAGYSFHRFQIVAWTIALGGVFVSAVYNQLTMPEFSATMLGLMGMSSGTYIGFKFPEQR